MLFEKKCMPKNSMPVTVHNRKLIKSYIDVHHMFSFCFNVSHL